MVFSNVWIPKSYKCLDMRNWKHWLQWDQTPYCDFFHYIPLSVSKLALALQDYTVYLSDGLHLSERGNQFVAQHLWGLLESRVAHLPFILPYWGDVDPKSPESSLLCDQWRLWMEKLTRDHIPALKQLKSYDLYLWDSVLMFKMNNKDFYFEMSAGNTSTATCI